MHLVQAMDNNQDMRPILCLFEGVCTGAADGFARAAGYPASTLMHLGPGLGNGIANLHNARRAATPILNLIGDHPAYHKPFDTPLTSDIEGLARTFSCWVRTSSDAGALVYDAKEAIQAALTRNPGSIGQIASLIIPADCAWNNSHARASCLPAAPSAAEVPDETIKETAKLLDANTLLLLGSDALTDVGLRAAQSICQAKGCQMCAVTFPPKVNLGPELPYLPRMPYFPEQIQAMLKDVRTLVLVGAEPPASFFAYQDVPGDLTPADTQVHRFSYRHENSSTALSALAEYLNAPPAKPQTQNRPPLPDGTFSVRSIAQSLVAQIPDNAILSVDSGGGGAAFGPVQSAAPVMWINLTGGAIGQGGPAATGAALACPDRRVVALLGDGGAMYTIQCLWTQAREQLDVTTVIFNNASYQILVTEYNRLGINTPGAAAKQLFGLGDPAINWADLAKGMGVPGIQVTNIEAFNQALQKSFATPGPMLIDAVLTER